MIVTSLMVSDILRYRLRNVEILSGRLVWKVRYEIVEGIGVRPRDIKLYIVDF
jgi:hypothetical protein